MEVIFRTWIKKTNRYDYWGIGDVNNDGATCTFPSGDIIKGNHEQYTNQKDVKGTKLFVGDIVKDEFGCLGIVKFEVLRFALPTMYIEWQDGDITGFQCAAHCDIEKIGTVNENPELNFLKGETDDN